MNNCAFEGDLWLWTRHRRVCAHETACSSSELRERAGANENATALRARKKVKAGSSANDPASIFNPAIRQKAGDLT